MNGKVVVITGASAGIGAALAKLLGAGGAKLVLAARGVEALQAVAAAAAPDAIAVEADVTRRADVERLRDRALEAFGRVDVWINNAGRGITRPLLALTDDDLTQMIDVNVRSALYGMQAIVPHFQARGDGHLINVSSFLGKVPMATIRSAYSASKAALNSLTSTLRLELAASHPDVHVSLILPGIVTTAFGKNALHTPAAAGGPFAPPPGVPTQTAEEVAAVIADVIAHPVAERYTNPAQAELAVRYATDAGAVEQVLARGIAPMRRPPA
jgi:NADP-dependent 3-hydroxy acid dehydrogenase YdfG